MSSTRTCVKRVTRCTAVSESPRRIPLTSLTLLTVPEEGMLESYLREKEPVDVRLMRSMAVENFDASITLEDVNFAREGSASREKLVARHSKPFQTSLELELEKFMGAVTATEVPDAVLKTMGAVRFNSVFAVPQ